jgi:hypothetical protein
VEERTKSDGLQTKVDGLMKELAEARSKADQFEADLKATKANAAELKRSNTVAWKVCVHWNIAYRSKDGLFRMRTEDEQKRALLGSLRPDDVPASDEGREASPVPVQQDVPVFDWRSVRDRSVSTWSAASGERDLKKSSVTPLTVGITAEQYRASRQRLIKERERYDQHNVSAARFRPLAEETSPAFDGLDELVMLVPCDGIIQWPANNPQANPESSPTRAMDFVQPLMAYFAAPEASRTAAVNLLPAIQAYFKCTLLVKLAARLHNDKGWTATPKRFPGDTSRSKHDRVDVTKSECVNVAARVVRTALLTAAIPAIMNQTPQPATQYQFRFSDQSSRDAQFPSAQSTLLPSISIAHPEPVPRFISKWSAQ